ncbi:MarR family transcriptional regulator [uncultured Cohaesibacter sp.]|uniref:MarR family transcriptional regulator n=1 Tax=uncultured Cohaesibacter sp. TaxID=1002546 RepID=UPI0029C937F1|nr:MarR family transcriptional regulator [uncultured Cohaesibacter sp.]
MSVTAKKLLIEQLDRLGSKKAVADELDVSRTQISLYLADKYEQAGGRVDRLEAKIIAAYSDRVFCPHLGSDIKQSDCEDCRTASIPSSDPALLRRWIACKTCPLNPSREESSAC